jgi:predicted peptidase
MCLALALALLLAMTSTLHSSAAQPLDRFSKHLFQEGRGTTLPYRLLAPREIKSGQKYPLVIFLHGAGERGSDNEKQLVHGMKNFASDEIMAKYPAFVIAPQCPEGMRWVEVDWSADSHAMPAEPSRPMAALLALVDRFVAEQPVDERRIYLTGLSMGGYGVWDAIQRKPDLFAAAAPICGGGDPAHAERIKHIPVWAFHGDSDTAVKPKRSREMIEALKKAGGSPKYTEYASTGHDSWTRTYADPQFFAWLFAQKK